MAETRQLLHSPRSGPGVQIGAKLSLQAQSSRQRTLSRDVDGSNRVAETAGFPFDRTVSASPSTAMDRTVSVESECNPYLGPTARRLLEW